MINVAVVGAGHWGPNLIRNFADGVRSRVRWVVDLDEARLAAVSGRYPGVRLSADARPALEDPEVHAVVVATPTSTHEALVRAALEAGKHVLVEKPLTDSSASARELVALARDRERVLLVGHVFLFNPAVQWVAARLREGALGRVLYLSSVRTNLGPIRRDVNASWDLAAQDVSIFNHWLGAAPLSASACGKAWVNQAVQDAVFATLRYPGDVLAHLHVSWLNPRKVRDITVVAADRMLTYDDMSLDEPIRVYDKRVVDDRAPLVDTFAGFRSVVHTGDITIPPVRTGEPLARECAHFLDCIERGERPLCGGEPALDVVRTLEAIDRSMAGGGCEVAL